MIVLWLYWPEVSVLSALALPRVQTFVQERGSEHPSYIELAARMPMFAQKYILAKAKGTTVMLWEKRRGVCM